MHTYNNDGPLSLSLSHLSSLSSLSLILSLSSLSLSLSLLSSHTHTHTHSHTHVGFYGIRGIPICLMVFYTVQTVCAIALHLNLALTRDWSFLLSPPPPPPPPPPPKKKKKSLCMIYKSFELWNYGYTENVLINHLLVIPMSYPCHYTNLCPHKPHKHTHIKHTHITHTPSKSHLTFAALQARWIRHFPNAPLS